MVKKILFWVKNGQYYLDSLIIKVTSMLLFSLYYRVVVIRVPLQGLYAILLEILWISISFLPQDGY